MFTIPEFDEKNILLQSASPHIHKLNDIFLENLQNLLLKFVKPSVMKDTELLSINFKFLENQKEDVDISIGNAAFSIVTNLKQDEKIEFYKNVRQYYLEACTYIIDKFPLHNEVLANADVANLKKIENQSFSKIRFFIEKFPFLLYLTKDVTEAECDSAWDRLQ